MTYSPCKRRWLCSVLLTCALACRVSAELQAEPAAAHPGAPAVPADATLLEKAFSLDEGTEVPRDATAAAELYRLAAGEGDPFAHLRLGHLAEIGDGVPQDYVAARAHYQRAADAGLPEARLRLAICHLEGWGGPADRAAFVRELRAAAEADYVPAQTILANVYFAGLGVPADTAEGIRWLERAAALKDADAQLRLGRHAERARRLALSPDLALARNWYELSAEQEYHASMRAMARTFLTGDRETRNWQLGQRWLELASEGSDPEAPFILAACELLHVDAPSRNVQQARAWLELAASRHNDRAAEVLEFEKQGRPLPAALRHVLSVPFDERYIQRFGNIDRESPTHVPQLYRLRKPFYPPSLRLTETTGNVVVEFIVDTTGRVVDPKPVESSHPLFAAPAVEAVRQWRFHPGKKDGRLVNVRMRVPVQFALETEQLQGIDGLLGHAAARAQELGPEVAADAVELGLARPASPLPTPALPNGTRLASSRALLLLVLDQAGHPIRGHVLHVNPEEHGPVWLQAALSHRFHPRVIDGQPVQSNVVLAATSERVEPVFR